MDCESDESERWEDFFGSSIDISPALIAYYDRLSSSTTNSHSNNNNCFNHTASTTLLIETNSNYEQHQHPHQNQQHSVLDLNSSDDRILSVDDGHSKPKSITKSIPPPLPKLPPPVLHRRYRNFRSLSANVQRLISHSNTLLHPDDMNELHSIDNNNPNNGNYDHRHRSTTTTITPTTNASKFKHPLSKNMCQLTKSGSDLVIDDSDGGYATPPEIIPHSMANEYRYLTKNDHENPDDPDNLDKTPTNQCPLIQFEHVLDTFNGNGNGNGHDNHHHEGIGIDDEYENVCMVNENNLINEESSIASKKSFIHSFASRVEPVAMESMLSNESKSDISLQSSPTLSQKSTDSETKMIKSQLFTIKAQASEQSSKNSSLERNSLADDINLDNSENNYETIDEPNDDDVSVTAPAKQIHSPTKCDQINIDLKRTKIRPLSTVSISSTSSSSSSVSDEHSTNQTAISYLASVESLADHSENELVALSATLTVTERACLEIIDSERSYVDDLGQVIKGYLNDWRERDCLKEDALETLFGNIQEVHEFSTILLNEFDQTGMDPTKISKCFIRLQDQFDVYTQYCTCYPDAISLLTTLLQASNTNALLASTQKSLQHTLPLGSYLLKPVQRILKYHLLLDNLRKHCDAVEVLEAHGIMRNVARHIDQVKRNLEQQSRVRELSGILDGWLGPELTVLGDLIREGTLMENNKPRTVLLFETMLIITKKKEDNRLQFKTYIHCKNLMLIEHFPGEPASFSVIPYNDVHPNQIKLTARNRDQKRQWAQHIKQVMLAHFDIPNRAKELLFKLGEEDDRTPDKNTWKWNNNSSTTPEYLERRNQYRRSEMRYRSKKQRKIFSASLSMVEDSFDKDETNESGSKTKVLDSMIKELQERNSLSKHADGESTTSTMSLNDLNLKSDELSQNEYEMPFDANKALPSKPASALEKARSKLQEVRMYNTKTLPKRIANLKKQRSKTLKETSKFYMALPEENSETVLKITESSDDIAINDARTQRRRASLDATDTITKTNDDRKMSSISLLSPMNLTTNKNKRDIDIISELLKDHKDFERILKKPPKKLSGSDSDVRSMKFSRSESFMSPLNALRLPLPPIPIEGYKADKADTFVQRELPPEPIYESLLRNVHVPYKFPSPVLNRSFSSPNSRFLKVKRPTEAPPKRPDSDYVTLTFDENGELTGVDDEIRLPKHGSHFRKSDTNINYHVRRLSEDSSIIGNTEILASRESTSSETDYSGSSIQMPNDLIIAQHISQSTDIVLEIKSENNNNKANDLHKSVDHLNISKTAPKIPERRISDVTKMQRQSIIHKQGSRALGSRIASSDYADPKTLFSQNYHSLANKNIALVQRDSAFSLTSSNDSVNLTVNSDIHSKLSNQQLNTVNQNPNNASENNEMGKSSPSHSSSSSSGDDSYYEKTVETYLENDGIFRDSAIYSDDNNEKPYIRLEHIYSTIEEIKLEENKIKPPPPPKLNAQKRKSIVTRAAPPIPEKPSVIAPVLPSRIGRRSEPVTEKEKQMPSSPPPSLPKSMPPVLVMAETPTLIVVSKSQIDSVDASHTNVSPGGDGVGKYCTDSTKQSETPSQIQELQIKPKEQNITPPPVPARNNSSKNTSWVLKQIQNFDK